MTTKVTPPPLHASKRGDQYEKSKRKGRGDETGKGSENEEGEKDRTHRFPQPPTRAFAKPTEVLSKKQVDHARQGTKEAPRMLNNK